MTIREEKEKALRNYATYLNFLPFTFSLSYFAESLSCSRNYDDDRYMRINLFCAFQYLVVSGYSDGGVGLGRDTCKQHVIKWCRNYHGKG